MREVALERVEMVITAMEVIVEEREMLEVMMGLLMMVNPGVMNPEALMVEKTTEMKGTIKPLRVPDVFYVNS